MAAQGRKNVHGKAGVRFKTGYTASKNKAMLRNVVTDLIVHEEVQVTSGVTKDLKRLADRLVTLAKRGDLHARRLAAQTVRSHEALKKLFEEIGPRMKGRNGGYTRSFKLGQRRGDAAEVTLVRWSDK